MPKAVECYNCSIINKKNHPGHLSQTVSIVVHLLKVLGCDRIQGYYVCKGLPEKELVEFLRNARRIRKNCLKS
jgi:hypothetical protein